MFKNKLSLIISSLVILSPCILGIITENASLCIGPIILLAAQWLCLFITAKDPRNKDQSNKLMKFVIWIIPIISVFTTAFMMHINSEKSFSPTLSVVIIIAPMFIFIGNYLPKCKRNSTLGIKIKRTLESDSNWNATHRFAGKLWVACGILMLFSIFLDYKLFTIALILLLLIAVIPPIVYSHIFYKKELKNGTYSPDKTNLLFVSKKAKGAIIAFIAVLLIVIGVISFTGEIDILVNEEQIVLDATYWNKTTININEIKSIEYSEKGVNSVRVNGFASAKLLLGIFNSEELGKFESYRHTKCNSAIIVKTENGIYVFNAENNQKTKELYDSLIK